MPEHRSPFAWIYVACVIASVATSYFTYEARKDTPAWPKSTTAITPLDALYPRAVANVATGESSDGVGVNYAAVLGNSMVLFLPLSLAAVLVKRSRSDPPHPARPGHVRGKR